MFSEILTALTLQTQFFFNPTHFDRPSYIHSQLAKTEELPEFEVSASATPIPLSSLKPKSTAAPKKTAAVKSAQTSSINSQSVLQALNVYRKSKGVPELTIDSKLQEYAQERALYLKSLGKLDKHAKHKEFMKNGGFDKLGFSAVAENQGWNFKGDATGLIEDFYGKSAGHNKNQLNPVYTHVGIGISGAFTDLVFGGKGK